MSESILDNASRAVQIKQNPSKLYFTANQKLFPKFFPKLFPKAFSRKLIPEMVLLE